jgi:hypothetical protein
MKQSRKRAPGAGRPPGELGAKRATLSLRLPTRIQAELVAAKEKNKRRSLSEEIMIRLDSTLARDRGEDRPRHIRALSEVVARLALALEGRTKRSWVEDRYTQQQLSKAIDLFLYTYSRGEAVVPPTISAAASRDPADTFFADRLGESIAGGIISLLQMPPKPPETEEEIRLMKQGNRPIYYPESWWGPWQLEQDLKPRKRK